MIFVVILWLTDDLQWYEYQSDYYAVGTVIDKTIIGHYNYSEIYLTVEFENGETVVYRPTIRSDCPNEYLFKIIMEGKTYEFRMGIFINNHYGRKENEQVENIISANLLDK